MKYTFHFLSLITLFALFSCKTSQSVISENKLNHQNDYDIESISIKINEKEEIIQFTIKNLTEKDIFLLNSEKLYIEKEWNGDWEKLHILDCPCGAPCARPTNEIEIPAYNSYTFTWNKMESWCGERNEKGIPSTEYKAVNHGKYRLRLGIKVDNSDFKIIYKEFNI